MTTDSEALANAFHGALVAKDWEGMRTLFHDDATWTLPGDNVISGQAAGVDEVIDRAKLIASYGLSFKLEHILLSRDNMALGLHNTAERDGIRLRDGRIAEVETFLSDIPGMNRFFVRPS